MMPNCVMLQVEKEIYEFFPLNRALCLSSVDIDSTESKIDDLLHAVTAIAKKQREDVSVAVWCLYHQYHHIVIVLCHCAVTCLFV